MHIPWTGSNWGHTLRCLVCCMYSGISLGTYLRVQSVPSRPRTPHTVRLSYTGAQQATASEYRTAYMTPPLPTTQLLRNHAAPYRYIDGEGLPNRTARYRCASVTHCRLGWQATQKTYWVTQTS
ncbi:hypothetical protein F4778DRAFT_286900 [Xylariomycetidae sp. FL2044]|nr:hypothetical protein F4778DRAFT_286900 [Xylariomycetidae sp. FL2044]